MEQRLSLITLGVADVAAAKRFYERLGWHAGLDVQETVFFQVGGMILTLWGRDKLAEDSASATPAVGAASRSRTTSVRPTRSTE